MRISWEDAIYEARRFHNQWYRFDGDPAIKNAAYDKLPNIVKEALNYLVETVEIQ